MIPLVSPLRNSDVDTSHNVLGSRLAKYGFVVHEAVRVDIGSDFVMDDFIMAYSLR